MNTESSLQSDNQIMFVLQIAGIKTKNTKMNTTEILGNWNKRKDLLKHKFGFLTDNDLLFEEGRKEEMLGKLQIKLGKTKEEILKIISTL